MGEAGRARARAMFTWPRVVRRMLDVMTPLVDARGHAGIADPLASAALPQ
jgi:hypothetical protein